MIEFLSVGIVCLGQSGLIFPLIIGFKIRGIRAEELFIIIDYKHTVCFAHAKVVVSGGYGILYRTDTGE